MAVMKGRAVINLLAICLIVAVIAGTEISTAEGKCSWYKKISCSKGYDYCKKYCGKAGAEKAVCRKGYCYCCCKCKNCDCD